MAITKAPPPQQIDKERKAIELRRAGATYDDIARAVGYKDPSGARAAYQRALKRTLQDAGSEEVREIELDRLDRLQRAAWTNALAGDVNAINTVLRIMHRRAAYLGLDAPVKQEIKVETVDAASIDAEVARLVEMLGTNAVTTKR
jgi:hypothetical protein